MWWCRVPGGHVPSPPQAFLGLRDQPRASRELLVLAGAMADQLVSQVKGQSERLLLLAQTPPSLLEWLRQQAGTAPRGIHTHTHTYTCTRPGRNILA